MDAKPSPTELTVLKLLWARSELSAREIHEGLADTLPWSYSSTRKTLERMAEKGLVTAEDAHGLRIYRAGVQKVPTLSHLMREFATRVLDLDGPLPAAAFAESPLLTAADLDELERLLGEDKGDD